MGVLYDASRLVEFNGAGRALANIDYTGEMRGVRGLCRYAGEDPIAMNLDIDMAFGTGPAATRDSHTYRYWVAVTRRGRAPIEKQYFDVDVRFPARRDRWRRAPRRSNRSSSRAPTRTPPARTSRSWSAST